MEIKYTVMTTARNGHDLTAMKKEIPELAIFADDMRDPMGNFLKTMEYTEKPCVHLEDDVILTSNFKEKIEDAISQYPDTVINFFSMRKADLTIGTRFEAGRTFMMNQCFYLPENIGLEIYKFYPKWKRKFEHPTGYDILMADYFKANKMKYLIWCPNLVDHMEGKSRINSRRSSKRQSLTFKE